MKRRTASVMFSVLWLLLVGTRGASAAPPATARLELPEECRVGETPPADLVWRYYDTNLCTVSIGLRGEPRREFCRLSAAKVHLVTTDLQGREVKVPLESLLRAGSCSPASVESSDSCARVGKNARIELKRGRTPAPPTGECSKCSPSDWKIDSVVDGQVRWSCAPPRPLNSEYEVPAAGRIVVILPPTDACGTAQDLLNLAERRYPNLEYATPTGQVIIARQQETASGQRMLAKYNRVGTWGGWENVTFQNGRAYIPEGWCAPKHPAFPDRIVTTKVVSLQCSSGPGYQVFTACGGEEDSVRAQASTQTIDPALATVLDRLSDLRARAKEVRSAPAAACYARTPLGRGDAEVQFTALGGPWKSTLATGTCLYSSLGLPETLLNQFNLVGVRVSPAAANQAKGETSGLVHLPLPPP